MSTNKQHTLSYFFSITSAFSLRLVPLRLAVGATPGSLGSCVPPHPSLAATQRASLKPPLDTFAEVREKVRGEYGFSSLVKQNKKAKIYFVIHIAGFFFKKKFCYEEFAKQKKTKESSHYYLNYMNN